MRSFFTALALIAASFAAHAEIPVPPSPIVKTELTVNAPAAQSSNVVWAGVTFTMPEHWHIYWQNPGDSGLPTAYEWKLPSGMKAGEIVWPAPERLEVSGLVNYGYSNKVTLPVPLTAEGAPRGEITVKAKWLVCADVCIPESATLTATLPTETKDAAAILQAARDAAPSEMLRGKYAAQHDKVMLTLTLADSARVSDAYFFPLDDGILANAAKQEFAFDETTRELTFTLARGSADTLPEWNGVVRITQGNKKYSATVVAVLDAAVATASAAEAEPVPAAKLALISALMLAFLGGLILNIMPCVLPILALKALTIAKKADASRAAAATQGVAYTIGVVGSFLIIAGLMLALKASGAAIGWGFQLQNVWFVGALTLVMLAVAFNLLGVFHLPVLFGTKAAEANENTVRGSLLTGALAVLVATPCTAPFMATAIGATLTYPAIEALLVFAALGFGMAAPFLLISVWPAARRLLPKPGAWMHRFKQILAIPMFATAAWLIWVLVQLHSPSMPVMDNVHVPYSAEKLRELRSGGTPVLVDVTAAWCLTCKVNERVALQPKVMQDFLYKKNVVLMVADWTNSDPAITAYLASFGRNGVPLYVYYPPNAEPKVLPQILTPSLIRAVVSGQPE